MSVRHFETKVWSRGFRGCLAGRVAETRIRITVVLLGLTDTGLRTTSRPDALAATQASRRSAERPPHG